MYQRRTPTALANSLAGDPPQFFPIGESQHDKKRVRGIVACENDRILMDTRRASIAPTGTVLANVDNAQFATPFQVAIQIVTIEPFRPKKCDQVLAIDREARIRLRGLDVTSGSGLALASDSTSKCLSRLFVKAQDHPLVISRIVGSGGLSPRTQHQCRGISFRDRRANENPVAPNDRTGMTQTWDGSSPKYPFRFFRCRIRIPGFGKRVSLENSSGPWTSKSGPILRRF